MFLKITYYVNVCNAQKTQAETKITDGVTDKPWFSDEDFEELTQTIKHVCGICGVCINDLCIFYSPMIAMMFAYLHNQDQNSSDTALITKIPASK